MSGNIYFYQLGQKFSEIVERFPNKVALQYPNGARLTFIEFDELSNKLANYLFTTGLRSGDVVAIFNEKSPLGYGLMIACVKSGIIYTNLDINSPYTRIEKILTRCMPKVIFVDLAVKLPFPELYEKEGMKILALNEIDLPLYSTANIELSANFHGNNPAYIMFTSGSTGFPKGAVMSHDNLLNFIEWGRQTFGITENDIFTNVNPIYFDNSVFDFYVSLFNGATLVPLDHYLVRKPRELVDAINKARCTVWFSVPSLLVYLLTTKSITKNDFSCIKKISFGGEGFPKSKLKLLFDMFGNRIQLFNVYGPTECTCICSSYQISNIDFENMHELAPLGYLAENFGYYIIPQSKDELNIGELCLVGPCVGLGYFNDPERTAASFIKHPEALYDLRMYRTGDLVEKADNGHLHFRGRIDFQIKHMGYRIELQEIEAAFSSLSLVDEVAVVYEKLNSELGQIVAFVVVNDPACSIENLMKEVRQILPAYMLPRKIQILPVLPKNQNGKIDRSQLNIS